jgi:hypothetical protein
MRLFLTSRRAFLAALASLLAALVVPLQGWLRRRNPLVGNWRILEYICDGKRVMTEGMDVTVSITGNAVSTRIRMQGYPDHVEVHNYSIRRSTQEIDMDAANGGMFLGVYSECPRGLILAWDTVGRGRPPTVDEPARFGLNRMVLTRDDTHTRSST